MPADADLRTTRDVALATFARLRGLQIVRATRRGKHDFEFVFKDPDGSWPDLEVEFVNSECRRYDDEMRALKKLASGNGYG